MEELSECDESEYNYPINGHELNANLWKRNETPDEMKIQGIFCNLMMFIRSSAPLSCILPCEQNFHNSLESYICEGFPKSWYQSSSDGNRILLFRVECVVWALSFIYNHNNESFCWLRRAPRSRQDRHRTRRIRKSRLLERVLKK